MIYLSRELTFYLHPINLYVYLTKFFFFYQTDAMISSVILVHSIAITEIIDTSLYEVQYINTYNKLFISENDACFDLRQSNYETRRGALDRQVREYETEQQQTADSRIPNSV